MNPFTVFLSMALGFTLGTLTMSCSPNPEPPPITTGDSDGGSADDSEVFNFSMTRVQPFVVRVTKDGVGFAGAIVSILSSDPNEPEITEHLWQGRSDDNGNVTGKLDLVSTIHEVVVVVHATNHRGPYTDNNLRLQHGPVAPASVQTMPLTQIGSLNIQLTKMED